jgi:hypothetical protein
MPEIEIAHNRSEALKNTNVALPYETH